MKRSMKSFFGSRKGTRRRQHDRNRQTSFTPRLEGLEDRALLSAISVLNTDDSGPGSLREAIAAANTTVEEDVISFAKGVNGTIKLTSGELSITQDLKIDGPSSGKITISGNNASRIFNISGAETEVSIDDLKLVRGYAEDAGGAILHTGQMLSVRNVEFKHNQVVGNEGGAVGGAIAILRVPNGNGYPTTTVEDSRFTHNNAFGANGGLFGGAFGGAINNQGLLTIERSTLTQNGAFGGSDNNNDNADPEAFAFVGLAFGGAVNNNSGGTLFMDDCVVTHNQAVAGDRNTGGSATYVGDAGGGGIENIFFSTATVTNSTIAHNTVVGGDDSIHAGGNDGGYASGGGIGNRFSATLTLRDSEISYNDVIGGDRSTLGSAFGGGLHNSAGGKLTVSDSEVLHNRVTGGTLANGNGAMAGGGGLANVGAFMATIIDSVFSNNQATGGQGVDGGNAEGGGIYNNSLLTFSGEKSVVKRNHARGGAGSNTDGRGLGGGVFNAGSVIDEALADVFANHASDEGDDWFNV